MIGVLVSGNGSNLQALIDAGLPIACVSSNKPGVRALERARAAGIAARVFDLAEYPTREERDAAMAEWHASHAVRLVVCAGYMHLLTRPFLDRFADRIVNVHPSLLPRFPGARALADALDAGVAVTGVTVHLVDDGLDTGPILRQEPVPVEPRGTLEERIHAVEHRILPEVVRKLVSRSSGAAGKGGKRAARRTAHIGADKRRPCSILPPAASGGGGAGLRPAGAAAGEERECAR